MRLGPDGQGHWPEGGQIADLKRIAKILLHHHIRAACIAARPVRVHCGAGTKICRREGACVSAAAPMGTDRHTLWEIGHIVRVVEAFENRPRKRGPYKKRAAG